MEGIGQDKKSCSVWADAVHAAQNCQCKSECYNKPIHPHKRFSYLALSYANSLMGSGYTEQAMAQYKVALDAAPNNTEFLYKYSDALVKAGQAEESYGVLHKYVERATLRLNKSPTRQVSYDLAATVKRLSNHSHISQDHNQQLRLLLNILSRLRTNCANHDSEIEVASLEQEALWDYANILAATDQFEASEKAFAELVELWRIVHQLDWENAVGNSEEGNSESHIILINQWYFLVLDMYAKILAVNGKESESRMATKLGNSLLLRYGIPASANVRAPSNKVTEVTTCVTL